MKRFLSSIFVLVTIALSGCAVGPLVSHETARTVGRSNHELVGGFGRAGFVFKWNYGVTENLDLGLHWETLSIGVRAKYALINNPTEGWSLASALGIGSSVGGSHYYGDIIASYLAGSFEPYSAFRFVYVKNDPIEFKNKETSAVDFTITKSKYSYGQIILGTRYWFTPNWLLSLEVSPLLAFSSGIVIANSVLAGAALGYRF